MNTFTQDFAKIRYMPAFVDKSMLIKTILENQQGILVTAPRRFGKSVNLSMIKRFFECSPDEEKMKENRKLFEGTQIGKCSKLMVEHQGKYPVIFLDFKANSTVSSLATARKLVSEIVQTAYKEHKYLASASSELDDDERESFEKWRKWNFQENKVNEDSTIFNALKELAIYLSKFWKKEVIVLSDEYDSICCRALMRLSLIHI